MASQTVNLTSNTTWTVPTKCYIITRLFLVGGGGGGRRGFSTGTDSFAGGGGGGGRVRLLADIQVTPGSTIPVTIGPGGAGGTSPANGGTTSFGAYSVTGGSSAGGTAGGVSSSDIFGTVVSTSSSSYGGAGAGASANSQAGGNGYFWNGSQYGGGGGGGILYALETVPRPIPVPNGGGGGGGRGGGEGSNGEDGAPNTGGGGGGGASLTRTTGKTGSSPITSPETNGGTGGTGFVQVIYDEAEATIIPDGSSIAESGTIILRLYTRNIPNGITLPYTLSGPGLLASDLSPPSLTGSFVVSSTDGGLSGTAQVSVSAASDAGVTEGLDTITVALNNGLASNTFGIADLYRAAIPIGSESIGYLSVGGQYTIRSVGTTDFTTFGAASNTVGATFTATGTGVVEAGNFIVSKSYTINTVANFDFTKIGSSSNSIGTTFTATGTGFTNATSMVAGQVYTIITLGTTDFTNYGNGWVTAGSFASGTTYRIVSVGTTDFLSIGASANTVGTTFVATGGGTGTGKAIPVNFVQEVGDAFTASGPAIGTGTVMYSNTTVPTPAHPILGSAIQGNGTVQSIWISKSIQVADYNNIQAKVANIMGVGSGNSGYNQTVFSSQVSTSSRVSVNDWTNLKYDIINAYTHQIGTTPSLVTPSVGNLVKANTFTSPYTQYDTWADVVTAQKFNVASTQAYVRTGPYPGAYWYTETAWPGALGAKWTSRIYSVVSVTWPSSTAARSFFNSGGEIRFASARSGGVDPALAAQGASWQNLLNGSGTQGFGGNKPTQDVGALNGGNFYRLSNGFNVWQTRSATTPYSANNYQISARSPGVSNNNTGSASTVEFLIEWIDNHVGLGGAVEGVDGTISLTVTVLEPTGSLVPLGNFSVTIPQITIATPITT